MEVEDTLGEAGREVLVRVTYLDPLFEFVEGDEDMDTLPSIPIVGHLRPSRFTGCIAVASEVRHNGEARGVTHIPQSLITSQEVLHSQSLQVVRTETM